MNNNTFSLSSNLENGLPEGSKYYVTPNVEKVLGEIINAYHAGIHSITIIGTYGTGKSTFLLNVERDLSKQTRNRLLLKNPGILTESEVEILNIIGDSRSLSDVLRDCLKGKTPELDDTLSMLKEYCNSIKKKGKFLLIAIDEFGKVLEHASKNNPDEELYFFQKFTEYINAPTREILLLTTLHQNFSSYAKRLGTAQKNEWTKVKGRFMEVVFAEPVEQLLFLAAEHLSVGNRNRIIPKEFSTIYNLAIERKFISADYNRELANRLYPLDPFAGYALTKAIQRYGQNERSLFSFLNSRGSNSLTCFKPDKCLTYNLSEVYDYIVNSFHSFLNDANSDSMAWGSIRLSIERIEGNRWPVPKMASDAIRIVKAIGMANLFGNGGFSFTVNDMAQYATFAMQISNADSILKELLRLKLIRFAEYRQRLILFEGTDINIDEEIAKADMVVPRPAYFIDDLRMFFNHRMVPAKYCYYHRGTPRYFEYQLLQEATIPVPVGDIDGFIQLIFSPVENYIEELKRISAQCDHPVIYAYFSNSDSIVTHVHTIQKYRYIIEKVLIDKSDKVALKEMSQLLEYEKALLNKTIADDLYSFGNNVTWLFQGNQQVVNSQKDFNKLLSTVCETVYCKTPIVNNELFNKHKLSSSISGAKAKYLAAMLENGDQVDFGFEKDKFPPEKTIYYSLLKNTGLHVNGEFVEIPSNTNILSLWNACEEFLRSTTEKPRKITELIGILSTQPYKIKDGFLDFWIPTYLYIKRQDYSLYGDSGQYIPNVNSEFFDLLKKHPGDFKIKAYSVDGIKLQFFNQYRRFIGQSENANISGDSFIETIKPFFFFYNKQLNDYAKNTQKIDHKETIRFRDVLAKAKDPEKTFFEDLPEALGYDKTKGEEFIQEYCSIIQRAIRELRGCYNQLIDRIEIHLVEGLGLSSCEYSVYVKEIQDRLSTVKPHLLTPRLKEFYQHAISQFDKRLEWYQSVCYAVLGSPLDKLQDSQEAKLLDDLIFLFRECEKQAIVSERLNYKIDENEELRSSKLEQQIDSILTGDDNLDVYTLMRILQKKINKNG